MARTLSAHSGRRGMVTRPQALAGHLADFARHLRMLALENLASLSSTRLATLYRQAIDEVSPDLSHDAFADLLAQVLVYCSLRVRCFDEERKGTFPQALHTFLALPGLPPFARRLLATLWQHASDGQDELALCVRDLLAFLRTTNIQVLLEKLRPACLQTDPLIYFYEMFLAAYAPRQRSQRGVYYTPAPVIAYMVAAIDELLRETFAYAGGLVEAFQDKQEAGGILCCDPACGTGAFLRAVLEHTRQVYRAEARAQDWRRDLLASILPRLVGSEIMPVAYLLANIELAAYQAALDLPTDERANWAIAAEQLSSTAFSRVSLANALVDTSPRALPSACLPIILGNPPYAGHSLNHSTWLGQLLESYKTSDVGLKKPAQAKWLSDDYVQFLRLAQWQIEQAGRGIVAFLTNHSYLDNPTFRGMRLSLLRSFDEIYILDLHGNSKRRELAPGGASDRNIFTIQQGVAIGIFVKRTLAARSQPSSQKESLATVYHADIWGPKAVYAAGESGKRELSGGKLGWLASHKLSSTPWQISSPAAPFYLFTPRDERHQAEYMANWSLPTIFALNGSPAPGLVTCQDEFAISWSAAEAEAKIATLLATSSEAEARSRFRLCSQGQWDYATARRELAIDAWRNELGRVCYRPFDTRWTIFERHVAVHLRERVTRHMRAGPNLALAVGRAGQVINGGDNWDIAFCTRLPTEFNLYRRGGNYLFPLYLYSPDQTTRVANLAPAFLEKMCQRLALRWLPDGSGDLHTTFGPDDIFAYIYALLFAPCYRARYADFLKIDFPRVPLPAHADLFRALCPLGRSLSQIHLLEAELPHTMVWSGCGNDRVSYVAYLANEHKSGRIAINADRYLDHVSSDVWELTIGGYQVAKKWLWDRRGRSLSNEELAHYCQIIASLARTLELMSAIDRAIEHHGGWPL